MKYKVIDKWLTPNPYSRSQKPIKQIKGIAIHWVGNPNTTALANIGYFESLKDKKIYASAHEFIDLNGDVFCCIPPNEVAYAVGSKTYTKEAINKFGYEANYYTYNIECCHIDWNGKMTNETYNTLVNRCVDLCKQWDLNPIVDLWLHQEIVGWKDCHRWFVNNPNEWKKFKELVNSKINKIDNKLTLIINKKETDVPLKIENDRSYAYVDGHWIKLRELANLLHATITFDNANKTVILITN